MDTRNLIALGMLMVVTCLALKMGAFQPHDVKEIVLVIGSGIIGVTLPRARNSGRERGEAVSDMPAGDSNPGRRRGEL